MRDGFDQRIVRSPQQAKKFFGKVCTPVPVRAHRNFAQTQPSAVEAYLDAVVRLYAAKSMHWCFILIPFAATVTVFFLVGAFFVMSILYNGTTRTSSGVAKPVSLRTVIVYR